MSDENVRASVLYVSDFGSDPADFFDLAYLLRSPNHDLQGVCLPNENALPSLRAFFDAADGRMTAFFGGEGLRDALNAAPIGVNLIVVGGYARVARLLAADRALFREKQVRLFLVGGHVNDYSENRTGERLPIDPRLPQKNPERFAPEGDRRLASPEERAAWTRLLTSGEGIIWLPRDICLWRYAASGVLADGGPLCDLLLSLLPAGSSEPVLLSALPALLLAVQPDPFAWMRLFRVVAARVEADPERAAITQFATRTDAPNLYAVIAIDGTALGKLLTARLRDRPLSV